VLVEAILQRITPDVSLVVVMGDTLDRFGDIKTAPLTLAISFLHRLSELVKTVLIIGNHDLPHKCCDPRDNHPFTALHYWGPRMVVADYPIQLEVEGMVFTFAPYYEPGQLIPKLDSTIPEWRNSRAVFGHQELHCISYGGGAENKGDKWELQFPLAVMGHIHDHCRPISNVLYVGASMQRAFNEQPNKTISLLKFECCESGAISAGNMENVNWSEERISLGLPSLVQITISASEVPSFQPPGNCRLKLTIQGTEAELATLRQHPQVLKWREQQIRVNLNPQKKQAFRNDLTPQRQFLCYGQMLEREVSNDDALREIFRDLFQSCTLPDIRATV